MTARRLVLPLVAVTWVITAAIVVGVPRLDGALPGGGAAPSAAFIAGIATWCGAAGIAGLALVDVVRLVMHRRVRAALSVPVIVVALGAALLVAGAVAQLTSYRV